MRKLLWLPLLLLPVAVSAYAPSFHLTFDGTLQAVPSGAPSVLKGDVTYVDAKFGPGANFPAGTLATYPAKGALDKAQGSLAFWLRPNWDGNDGQSHGLVADVSDFNDKLQNTFYLWKWSTGQLRLDLRSPTDPYLTYDVSNWKAGDWHHIGATWDAKQGLALYVDGQCVARRAGNYDVHPWPTFNVGGDWRGKATADAAFDDLRFYPTVLQAAQMTAVMRGLPLEEAAITKLTAPVEVQVGKPFVLKLQAQAPRAVTRSYPLVVALDGVEVASVAAEPDLKLWAAEKPVDLVPISVTIPTYLRIRPHKARLTARLDGAITPAGAPEAEALVTVNAAPGHAGGHVFRLGADGRPIRDNKPFPSTQPGEGFLYDGVFYMDDETGRAKAIELIASGQAQEALPCRLIDSVDCTRDDHAFRQWGQSKVQEIIPGRTFRLTGAPDSVQEKVTSYGKERPALPGFAYTVATTPLPVPHVLVAELANDRERYTEIAVDAAPGSQMAQHLYETGPGDTRLVDLSTVYTGREYPCDGKPFRHSLIFYPKSNAAEVTITSSHGDPKGQSAAAVSKLWVYQLLDEDAALHNEVPTPDKQPQRTVGLFFPSHRYMYTQYGFSGEGDQQRRASVLSLFDYMRFMGANRLEFHPVAFDMKCNYNGGKLPNAGTYDVFDDILPLAEERGMQVVPCLDGLAFYDKSPEFTRDTFQLDKDGETVRRYFGDVPDPLRPETQSRLMTFMSEFLDKVRGSKNVPFVSFKVNGKMGTCYSGDAPNRPPEDAGYSEWNIEEFQRATGLSVPGTPGDAPSRYNALRANPDLWERWINWRCEATSELWLKCRDLVVSRGDNRRLLVKTILPNNHPGRFNAWQERKQEPLEMMRNHGYDPRLYLQEKGLRINRCLLVGSDRYFGEEANKTWQYDDRQQGFYNTAEGSETELYFVYWELPTHPKGFRVGPSSGPGRAFFEPLTYTLRMHNPYNISFYNWYAGSIGHEIELRRFIRAYRALPALSPKDFEGEIFPRDPRLVARWYGDRLAIINDTDKPQKVRITFPKAFAMGTHITDLGNGVELSQFVGRTKTRVEISLDAWDLATLDVKELPKSNIRKDQPIK